MYHKLHLFSFCKMKAIDVVFKHQLRSTNFDSNIQIPVTCKCGIQASVFVARIVLFVSGLPYKWKLLFIQIAELTTLSFQMLLWITTRNYYLFDKSLPDERNFVGSLNFDRQNSEVCRTKRVNVLAFSEAFSQRTMFVRQISIRQLKFSRQDKNFASDIATFMR